MPYWVLPACGILRVVRRSHLREFKPAMKENRSTITSCHDPTRSKVAQRLNRQRCLTKVRSLRYGYGLILYIPLSTFFLSDKEKTRGLNKSFNVPGQQSIVRSYQLVRFVLAPRFALKRLHFNRKNLWVCRFQKYKKLSILIYCKSPLATPLPLLLLSTHPSSFLLIFYNISIINIYAGTGFSKASIEVPPSHLKGGRKSLYLIDY